MNPCFLYYAFHLAVQLFFLLVLLDAGGRFFEVDFGRYRSAIPKTLLLACLLSAFLLFVTPLFATSFFSMRYRMWITVLASLALIAWLVFTLVFRLDQSESCFFLPIIAVGSWLLFKLVDLAIRDLFPPSGA